MKTILAVDQSTSTTKALLFNTDGSLIASVSVDHEQYYPQSGWVEHDAEEIYCNTITALKTLLEMVGSSVGDIVCMSITNQRETIVVFDRTTGKPLSKAIVWQCRRGDPICQALIDAGHNDTVQKKTGLKIDTYFPASKLKWLLDHEPQIKQKLRDGEALIGTIDTYLIYRLTGGQVFASDHTNASRTLLFNINTLRWDEELCDLFEAPIHALPEVRESNAQFGETDLGGLLEAAIPICGVMGDSQAALFAERCYAPGSAKVTFGTGSSVLLNIGGSMHLSASGNVTTIAWVYNGQTTYALEGIINFTGATIAWLRDQLKLVDTPHETEALARAVPDNDGVYLVPAFVGLSAPYWRADVKAAIVGLTPSSTKNHVVRAALESIAYRVKDVLDLMAQDAGIPLQLVHADGGAVRNSFLMQFVADMIRLTVRASSLPELSALGAVFSGALGMGIHASLDDLEKLPLAYIDYEPTMDAVQAEHYYAGWKAAVQRLL
jgi:glycerol kinase